MYNQYHVTRTDWYAMVQKRTHFVSNRHIEMFKTVFNTSESNICNMGLFLLCQFYPMHKSNLFVVIQRILTQNVWSKITKSDPNSISFLKWIVIYYFEALCALNEINLVLSAPIQYRMSYWIERIDDKIPFVSYF